MNKNAEETIQKITSLSLNEVSDDILFIALLGSYQDGEAVENYSDLDILYVLKSNESGAIRRTVIESLREVCKEVSKNTPLEISMLTHTLFDFEKYVDFEYLTHYSWGRVLYGDEEKYKATLAKIAGRKHSKEIRENLAYYNLTHARFNLFRKYVSWNRFNKKDYKRALVKLFIDNLIEICDWALLYKDVYSKSKKEMADNFCMVFQDLAHKDLIHQVLQIRKEWNETVFDEKNISPFLEGCISLIEEVISCIHAIHKRD